MIKQKEFKAENQPNNIKEVKMSLLGRGRGDFGLPKSKNTIFRIVTLLAIGGLTYSIYIKNIFLSLGIFALYLIIITNLARN
ncbi:MAG: hypothetical protein ABH864_04430 [archaeon]